MSNNNRDHLALIGNPTIAKMLLKYGENNEKILFSDFVLKINKRDKEQTRAMLITDRAIYNLLSNDFRKCKRRIPITLVVSITASTISDEFVIHVPDEYDYRFKSAKKNEIISVLKNVYVNLRHKSSAKKGLAVVNIAQNDLKDMTLTKDTAKLQTREERLRRKKQLLAEAAEDDDDDDEKTDVVTDMLGDSKGPNVKLEDFELLKVLGRGSFGKVMQVRYKPDGGIYAMKILKKKAIIARNQVEHTKAERKILQQLQHPFLMTLRYALQSKEKLYLVLDYYTGGELFFHLKNKRRFSEEVARIYVAEIGLALGHLHSIGVVYRDLKPENILLDDNGHVCLTDFGLAKDIEPDDQAHTFCGTPEYLAPEIVNGAGHNKMVDWWSLGILLYELTVGIPPFYSKNVNEMYNKIQNGVLRFPPFLSDHCKSLIVALLHRDPTKRLGCNKDIEEIITHPFFSVLDREKLMRKEIDVPYKPKVKGKTDTSNFDQTFTAEPVVDTMVPESNIGTADDDFDGFTFKVPDSDLHNSGQNDFNHEDEEV